MQKTRAASIDRATIAARAFELFRARGGQPGHDVEDWLRAEAELRRPPSRVAAVPAVAAAPVAESSLFPPPTPDEPPVRPTRRRTRKA